MNTLLQLGNGGAQPPCSLSEEKVDELIHAIRSLSSSVDTINNNYREMTRWLLIVVCVIALGKEVLGILRDVTHARAETVQTN